MIMSVYGGLSKGERNRIKTRVRASMSAITATEGRFLGGRPPYGFRLADAGPHPNPAKATDGKRLHKLEVDPPAAAVVRRIFHEFLLGKGYLAIAEGLTRDGIPCPSAHDKARNPHRDGRAWSTGAVRTILINPRYTGRQVWNKQRKTEILIDIDDVALGHMTRMRWNDRADWVVSQKVVHPVIVDDDSFNHVQAIMNTRVHSAKGRYSRRARPRYTLSGLIHCGLCNRRMQASNNAGLLYYRCRYPKEYALAGDFQHPRSVYVRESHVLGRLNSWIGEQLAPQQFAETIRDQCGDGRSKARGHAVEQATAKIAECDAKLSHHRAAIEAGVDPVLVAEWSSQTRAELDAARQQLAIARKAKANALTEDEITHLTESLQAITGMLADPAEPGKNRLYDQLGVRLTYHPEGREITAEMNIDADLSASTIGSRRPMVRLRTTWSCGVSASSS